MEDGRSSVKGGRAGKGNTYTEVGLVKPKKRDVVSLADGVSLAVHPDKEATIGLLTLTHIHATSHTVYAHTNFSEVLLLETL